jgi:hypothetical protein
METLQVSGARLMNESVSFGGTVTDAFFRPIPPRRTCTMAEVGESGWVRKSRVGWWVGTSRRLEIGTKIKQRELL